MDGVTDNRPVRPMTASTKAMLEAFRDRQRATLLWKAAGLSEADLRRSPVPSKITLLGMIKHLTYLERWCFQAVFAGGDPPIPWTQSDPDAHWRIEPGETSEQILALCQVEITCSWESAAAATLEDRVRRPGSNHTVAWVLCHMIQEVARHSGHADMVRELIHSCTGS